jgi:hypothetical protein
MFYNSRFKYLFGAVLFAIFVISCQKADEENPDIVYVHNTGVTDHDLHADAGSPLSIDLKVTDNKSLKQVKLEIYKSNSTHSHSTEVIAFKWPQLGVWDSVYVKNISGNEYTGTFVFNVPDTISGSWTVSVSALDEDGNVFTEESDLYVNNPHIPLILVQSTLPEVSSTGIIQIEQGATLSLTGNVVDLDSLDYVRVLLTQGSDTTWINTWQPIDSWTFNLNQVVFPAFDVLGNFKCLIEAEDLDGRYHYATASIKVVE